MQIEDLKMLLRQYLPIETADRLSVKLDKETPICITGRQRATGKTTLCAALRTLGYNAYEPWEVEDKENESDSNDACVTITLNRPIS